MVLCAPNDVVSLAELKTMLQIEIVGIPLLFVLERHIAVSAIVIELHLEVGIFAELPCPAAQNIAAAAVRIVAGETAEIIEVKIALERELMHFAQVGIGAEAALP